MGAGDYFGQLAGKVTAGARKVFPPLPPRGSVRGVLVPLPSAIPPKTAPGRLGDPGRPHPSHLITGTREVTCEAPDPDWARTVPPPPFPGQRSRGRLSVT